MKSFVTLVEGLYGALLKDMALQFPTIRKELDRDLSRIRSAIEERGLGFVTLDLPAYSKHLEQCLNQQRLSHSGIPYSGSWKRGCTIPKLFRGLYLRVFDVNGLLRTDCDVSAIRALRQLFNCCKKLELECSNVRRLSVVRSFFAVDRELRLPSLPWTGTEFRARETLLHFRDGLDRPDRLLPLFDDRTDRCPTDEADSFAIPFDVRLLDGLQIAADYIVGSFGQFCPTEWRAKHGPGAVSDRRGGRYFSKYSFPYWSDKLNSQFPSDIFAYANMSLAADCSRDGDQTCGLVNHEPPSELIAVPKDMKGPRLIASEPTSHQWCQQIILDYLSSRVSTSLISKSVTFRTQEPNKLAALKASIHGDFATVDLSEASDRVSCWTAERLFRASPLLLEAIHASRTRWIHNAIDPSSNEYYVLRKLSCMGSAITFPVQSILFATCGIVAYLYSEGIPVTRRTIRQYSRMVRVFGDDIIIPTTCLELMKEILHFLQLKVNHSKTHGSGKFRESCGLDAYAGVDVTPARIKVPPSRSRPESVISCVEVSNNFFKKGYHHTAAWIQSTTEKEFSFEIATLPPGSGLFGWKRPWFKSYSPSKKRFNSFTHQVEGLLTLPRGSIGYLPDHSARSLLQFFTEAPSPLIEWASGIRSRPTTKLSRRWVPFELLYS